MAEAEDIAVLEQFLLYRLAVDKAISAAVIIAQQVALRSKEDARLFAVDCQVFQENIAIATAPDSGAIFPDADTFADLRPLLYHQVCSCLLHWLLSHLQLSLLADYFNSSRAAKIFSGVIGRLRMRMPSASYTALAMAGAMPLVGTSPADFAPNGPVYSVSSTRMVVICGISSVDITL